MNDMGHWTFYRGKFPRPGEFLSFIYMIKNKENGRLYIGKKHYKILSGPNQGRVNDRWKSYTGSSKELNRDIQERGKRNF